MEPNPAAFISGSTASNPFAVVAPTTVVTGSAA